MSGKILTDDDLRERLTTLAALRHMDAHEVYQSHEALRAELADWQRSYRILSEKAGEQAAELAEERAHGDRLQAELLRSPMSWSTEERRLVLAAHAARRSAGKGEK